MDQQDRLDIVECIIAGRFGAPRSVNRSRLSRRERLKSQTCANTRDSSDRRHIDDLRIAPAFRLYDHSLR